MTRKQLYQARQREDESLSDFLQGVHFLALKGLPGANPDTLHQIAVESFLIGCKDKRAAEVVMGKEPATIFEALHMVKASASNHKALLGVAPPPSGQLCLWTRQNSWKSGALHSALYLCASVPRNRRRPVPSGWNGLNDWRPD